MASAECPKLSCDAIHRNGSLFLQRLGKLKSFTESGDEEQLPSFPVKHVLRFVDFDSTDGFSDPPEFCNRRH